MVNIQIINLFYPQSKNSYEKTYTGTYFQNKMPYRMYIFRNNHYLFKIYILQ